MTAEAAPHHLALNELEVEGYRTFAKVSPPLRAEADRLAVVEGSRDGTIDVIASDHCPQDQDSKRLPFAQAEFGVVGRDHAAGLPARWSTTATCACSTCSTS